MNGIAFILCFFIVIASLKNGFENITKLDIIIFTMAVLAIPIWLLTNSPVSSIIIVTIANMLAYIPTFRKSWSKPYEEPIYLYGINFFRHGLAILALANYSLVTMLVPIMFAISNGALAIFLIYRRHKS